MTNGICQAKSSLPLYVSMNVGMDMRKSFAYFHTTCCLLRNVLWINKLECVCETNKKVKVKAVNQKKSFAFPSVLACALITAAESCQH